LNPPSIVGRMVHRAYVGKGIGLVKAVVRFALKALFDWLRRRGSRHDGRVIVRDRSGACGDDVPGERESP
jgi:GNAT superfamily N-acetyltransferase